MFMRRDFDLNSVDVCVDSAPLKEVFKKTMVTQEIIFQSQVHELHRIYGTQRTLMMQNDGPDFFGGYYNLQNLGRHDSLKLSPSVGDDNNKRTRSGKRTWFDVDLSREVIDLDDSDDNDDLERRDDVFFDLNEDASSPKKQRNSQMLEFDLNKAYSDDNKNDDNGSSCESNEPTTPSASHELVGRAKGDSSDGTPQKEVIREREKSEDVASDVSSLLSTLLNVDNDYDAAVHEAAELLMNISFEKDETKEALETMTPEPSSDSFERFTLGLEECNDNDEFCASSSKPSFDLGESVVGGGVKIRRGRRRMKDFQRDVLPGMASLTRHEIREDINILEGVLRSREYKKMQACRMDDTWRVPTRTRQGKRRSRFS